MLGLSPRFWKKVRMTHTCWIWTGHRVPGGYGRLQHRGRRALAHRFTYEAVNGPVPAGMQIDHLCRNRACVNPDHLEAVTPQENVRRGISFAAENAKKTHCPSGHSLAGENLRVNYRGSRVCVACHRRNGLAYYYRTRKAAR